MAYETTTTKSLGARIQGAGEALTQGAQTVFDMQEAAKNNEMHRQMMQSQIDATNQQASQQKAQFAQQANQHIWGATLDAANAEDPKAGASLSFQNIQPFLSPLGSNMTQDQFAEQALNVKKALGEDRVNRMRTAPAQVGNIAMQPDKQHQAYQQALSDLSFAKSYMNSDQVSAAQKVIEDNNKEYIAYQKQIEASKIRVEAGATAKASASDDKRFNDIVDTLQGRKRVGAGAPFQMAQQRLALANAGEKWLDAMKSGKVVSNQAALLQLKSNIDQMVSGGSGRSAEMVKMLLEKTGKSSLASALQYISSNPQNSTTKAFLDQYQNELDVEKSAWSEKRNQFLDAAMSDMQDILAKDPNKQKRVEGILKGIAPDYQPSGSSLGPDEEIINGYVVNHKTRQVVRKAP